MYTCMCICAACLHVHTYKYSTHQTLPTHRRGAVPFVCSCPCDSSLSTWVAHSGLFSPWLFLDHELPAGQSDAHWVSLSPSRTCWNHSTFAAYISGCRYNNYMPTHVLMCLHIYTWNIQKKILKANFKFCGGKYAPPQIPIHLYGTLFSGRSYIQKKWTQHTLSKSLCHWSNTLQINFYHGMQQPDCSLARKKCTQLMQKYYISLG